MSTTKVVLGKPVIGDTRRDHGRRHVEQWSGDRFGELLSGIFAFDDVEAIGWEQYTPYFNDGDECVFSIYEARLVLRGSAVASEGEVDDFDDYSAVSVGDTQRKAVTAYDFIVPGRRYNPDTGIANTPLHDALSALDTGLSSGHFDNFLLESFGDHAKVVATRDDFTVDEFEHD